MYNCRKRAFYTSFSDNFSSIICESWCFLIYFRSLSAYFRKNIVSLHHHLKNHNMAEKIIGRHSEKALLEKYYNSGKAEFIAMYGRRRIGKTFLIREYFRNQFSFDMTGVLEGNKNEQMTAFHMAQRDILCK